MTQSITYVVAALDEETATRVLSLLKSPPASEKYNTLKERLLRAFTLNEAERAAQLLSMRGLGDRKPSQLMDSMLALLGEHEPCFLFKELFLRQLPDDIRMHLTHSKITDFTELALAADELCVNGNSNIVCKVQHCNTPSRVTKASEFCYYHAKFGDKANKCQPPCSYPHKGNGQAGRR